MADFPGHSLQIFNKIGNIAKIAHHDLVFLAV